MEKNKYFGTDGIRGRAGVHPITSEFMFKLGTAIGIFMQNNNLEQKIVIGKDTRSSSFMLESALEAGLVASGTNTYLAGVMPTPGVAYLTNHLNAELGISITASHNPYFDNGIKIFSKKCFKLSLAEEQEIEKIIDGPINKSNNKYLGKTEIIKAAEKSYVNFCLNSIPKISKFNQLKIILDCANGATHSAAPKIFENLNNNTLIINNKPDGKNINQDCGACKTNHLQQIVIKEKADIGIAFDGDGDRLIMIDNKGEIIDGDEILFIILGNAIKNKTFTGGLVGTIMSNLGLEVATKNLGIDFIRTPVGDHNISEKLLEKNWVLGGEASGHIINFSKSPTGDGILAALNILQIILDTKLPLHSLKKNMQKYPQKIINIPYKDNKIDLESNEIKSLIKNYEADIKPIGRILLRYSGTEPVLRIMVEGEDKSLVDSTALLVSKEIQQHFGNKLNSQTLSKNV